VLLAGSVGAASTARVTISDSSLTPRVARIAAPGSVTWTNKGRVPHFVASTTGAFSGFLLKVNARKTVRFARAGSYPYLVDGKRCAHVVAGGGPASGKCNVPGGGGRQPPPPPSSDVDKKTLRYDIKIVASLRTVEVFSGSNNPGANGTLDLDLSWTGTWRRVELEVVTVGARSILSTKQATSRRGSITGRLEYRDSRGDSGPCADDIDYAQYKAQALVNGEKPERGKRTVSFSAYALNTSAIDDLTHSRQKASCNNVQLGLPQWEAGPVVVMGVDIHHPPGLSTHPMDTSWSREATGTAFPLDRFLAGRGFTLDTGVRTARDSDSGYTMRFTGRAKYVYTPSR
jgi:hypothetical protein